MTKRPALVPARGGRRDGPPQSDLRAPRPAGPPGWSPRGGAAHRPAPPPRQTDPPAARPRPAPGAAKQPQPSMEQGGMRGATPPAMKGGQGQGAQTTPPEKGGEEPGHDPPSSPLPPLPPFRPAGCRSWATEAPAPIPPQRPGGSPPSPRRGPGARGGNAAKPVRHAPPRPHPDRQADPC